MKTTIKITKSSWGLYWYRECIGQEVIATMDKDQNKWHINAEEVEKLRRNGFIHTNVISGWVELSDAKKYN